MYTIIDVLDKLIDIEKKAYTSYVKAMDVKNIPQSVKTVIQVLAREEKRHIQLYKSIKEEVKDKEGLDIDFESYDKISKPLSDFSKWIVSIEFDNVSNLLQYAVDLEKKHLALAITIQGILVKNLEDETTIAYRVLTELIENGNKHIDNLEKFTK